MEDRPRELRVNSWPALIEMWKEELDTLGDWSVYACLAAPVLDTGLEKEPDEPVCRVQEDVPVTGVEAPNDEIRILASGLLAENAVGAFALTFRELVHGIERLLEDHPDYDLVLADSLSLGDETEATLCLPIGGIGMAGSSEDEYLQLEIVAREEDHLVN